VAIDLPEKFVQYLLEEGIFLQNENKAFLNYKDVEAVDMFTEQEWPEQTEEKAGQPLVTFTSLYEMIDKLIEEKFNGKCFPKLNGRSPSVCKEYDLCDFNSLQGCLLDELVWYYGMQQCRPGRLVL
jgi:hypothetical protein